MTIQEAIKSGKPFIRKGAPAYCTVDYDTGLITELDTRYACLLLVDDLLADDWELREDGE